MTDPVGSRIRAANLWNPHGRLAQMVERLVHTEEVTGSMPVSPTETVPTKNRNGAACGATLAAMRRLCERPGCSEPASVAYGMRAEDLIFWLDHLLESTTSNDAGALCRRHADSMVVPRNWTLDDQRDPDLHLFRPPEGTGPSRRGARRGRATGSAAEQLELGVDGDDPPTTDVADDTIDGEDVASDDAVEPWSPSFDSSDDLGGLLAARSPLLARAFRGDDRPTT